MRTGNEPPKPDCCGGCGKVNLDRPEGRRLAAGNTLVAVVTAALAVLVRRRRN